jgi:hypothetical protein
LFDDIGVRQTAAICLGNWSILDRPSARSAVMPGVSFQSRLLGVTLGDTEAWCICAGNG